MTTPVPGFVRTMCVKALARAASRQATAPEDELPVVAPERLRMASVDGLLGQHDLAARRRVDGLREEADHIQTEQEGQEWAIARRRVATVLAPDDGNIADRRNHTAVAGLNPQHRRGWRHIGAPVGAYDVVLLLHTPCRAIGDQRYTKDIDTCVCFSSRTILISGTPSRPD